MRLSVNRFIRNDKGRFAITGGANTLVDVGVLNVLTLLLGMPAIAANTISTGAAMLLSFVLNKKWVFKSGSATRIREFILFILATLIGLWIINNGVVYLLLQVLPPGIADFWRLNIAKLLATGASLVWNYFAYKYVVFDSGDSTNVLSQKEESARG